MVALSYLRDAVQSTSELLSELLASLTVALDSRAMYDLRSSNSQQVRRKYYQITHR